MKFKKWECKTEFAKYGNGRIAIKLIGTGNSEGELIAVATVNVPEEPLEPNEVIIKDYSENTTMYETLLKAGIIKPKHREIQSGWVTCPVAFLNIQP